MISLAGLYPYFFLALGLWLELVLVLFDAFANDQKKNNPCITTDGKLACMHVSHRGVGGSDTYVYTWRAGSCATTMMRVYVLTLSLRRTIIERSDCFFQSVRFVFVRDFSWLGSNVGKASRWILFSLLGSMHAVWWKEMEMEMEMGNGIIKYLESKTYACLLACASLRLAWLEWKDWCGMDGTTT